MAGAIGLPDHIRLILATFLEIGNAASIISQAEIGNLSLPLTAFSIAFSGISVYMQVMCFSLIEGRNRYYMKIKFTEGLIAFIISLVIYVLIDIVCGFVIGILAKIPLLGIIFSILGTVIGLYALVGIILSILVFIKVIK